MSDEKIKEFIKKVDAKSEKLIAERANLAIELLKVMVSGLNYPEAFSFYEKILENLKKVTLIEEN